MRFLSCLNVIHSCMHAYLFMLTLGHSKMTSEFAMEAVSASHPADGKGKIRGISAKQTQAQAQAQPQTTQTESSHKSSCNDAAIQATQTEALSSEPNSKQCPICKRQFTIRHHEQRSKFLQRQYCSHTCANRFRSVQLFLEQYQQEQEARNEMWTKIMKGKPYVFDPRQVTEYLNTLSMEFSKR